ncbi:MAG: multiubiquitin domain-containing protein [Chloroflexota bacterium]|nr:multiubiquitin domain-containing protein [Chloroflexota bacterium]
MARGESIDEDKTLETLEKIEPEQSECDDSGVESILDDIIDLEEYAKLGKRPPLAKGYRFKVNGDSYVVHDPTPTGLEVLTLAGLLPAKEYTLRVKYAGERPRKVGLDEKVDLRRPGVEKFKALPRDQTEG